MPRRPPWRPRGALRWSTFLRLHAQGILACNFRLAVTAIVHMPYVFLVIKHKSGRLVHCNVTVHPNAAWTFQQLREAMDIDHRYRFLRDDRDNIFAPGLDGSIRALEMRALRSAPHCPKMNVICERVIGTLRRECLDWLVPISESHLRSLLKTWIRHYYRGRPLTSLVPGIPDPPAIAFPNCVSRHRHGEVYSVHADSICGGLHHEYHLVPV